MSDEKTNHEATQDEQPKIHGEAQVVGWDVAYGESGPVEVSVPDKDDESER